MYNEGRCEAANKGLTRELERHTGLKFAIMYEKHVIRKLNAFSSIFYLHL